MTDIRFIIAKEHLTRKYVDTHANKYIPPRYKVNYSIGLYREYNFKKHINDYNVKLGEYFVSMFKYSIDGKEVTYKEFFEYVGKLHLSNTYGKMTYYKKGDEYWCGYERRHERSKN